MQRESFSNSLEKADKLQHVLSWWLVLSGVKWNVVLHFDGNNNTCLTAFETWEEEVCPFSLIAVLRDGAPGVKLFNFAFGSSECRRWWKKSRTFCQSKEILCQLCQSKERTTENKSILTLDVACTSGICQPFEEFRRGKMNSIVLLWNNGLFKMFHMDLKTTLRILLITQEALSSKCHSTLICKIQC